MKIQINTDNNIEVSDELTQLTQSVMESTLQRFAQQINRLEVHLSDENSSKTGGTDLYVCAMSVCPQPYDPSFVWAEPDKKMRTCLHNTEQSIWWRTIQQARAFWSEVDGDERAAAFAYYLPNIQSVLEKRGKINLAAFPLMFWGSLKFLRTPIRTTNRISHSPAYNWWRLPLKSLGLPPASEVTHE